MEEVATALRAAATLWGARSTAESPESAAPELFYALPLSTVL